MRTVRAFLVALLLVPATAVAQGGGDGPDWRVYVRTGISGSSHDSEPDGYKIYSGVAIDVALARRISEPFWIELAFRTESREVEGPPQPGFGDHLGSLEMLPVSMTLQWHPLGARGATVQPYLGAGFNTTVTWEKSGLLDTLDPPAHFGPVFQLGTGVDLSSNAVLSLDARWNTLAVELEGLASPTPRVDVDPLTLGVGLGLMF